jgi:hypothetical protein
VRRQGLEPRTRGLRVASGGDRGGLNGGLSGWLVRHEMAFSQVTDLLRDRRCLAVSLADFRPAAEREPGWNQFRLSNEPGIPRPSDDDIASLAGVQVAHRDVRGPHFVLGRRLPLVKGPSSKGFVPQLQCGD